jgi:hypothetical protein
VLRDFWWGHDRQEFSLEATMIRTAEWGPIRGFDAWWRRLAKTDMEAVMQGGVERIPASYWLFNMCRSRLALQFLEKSMRRRLEALELPGEDKDPWRFYHSLPTNRLRIVMHAEYLAHLIFCSIQMRGPTGKSPLVRRAAKELVRLQRATGGWPCWESDKQPGVEATAKAVHALCLAKPVGWKSAIERARKWLLKQQDRHGCWYDRGAPDATYLTVLVLDALALIDGKACTFAVQYNRANQEPRFEVAFSFPGADRKLIKNLANRMTKQYPKKKIFYDEYHQAELARPNLDTHLQRIYHQKARLNVVLLSSAYNEREWCGVEWRAIRDLINKKREEQVMFIKRGSPRVPGVFSLDGYISADDYSPNKIAEFIHQRIQSLKAPVSPS